MDRLAPSELRIYSDLFYLEFDVQDFSLPPSSGTALFGYYLQPVLSSVSPLCGPATGGTVVLLGGLYLEATVDVSLPVCRFGGSNATIVPASKLPGAFEFLVLRPGG